MSRKPGAIHSPEDDALRSLAAELGSLLLALNLRMSVAESCSGGGLGWVITATSGSSAWFEGGVISYSNYLKQELLGVSALVLDNFGAVSNEVAAEMARGVAYRCATDIGVAITGIAGPEGGSAAKPVGTVCFGWQIGELCSTESQKFTGDRESVRRQSIQYALTGTQSRLRGYANE